MPPQSLTLIALATACAGLLPAPTLAGGALLRAAEPIAGRYLVVLRAGETLPPDADLYDLRPRLADLAQDLASRAGGRLDRIYRAALEGFALEAREADARRLALDPRVAYVAEDGWVEVAAEQTPPSWGLDRVDQREGALDDSYSYFADGSGVDLYVVDTGIRSTHVDFEGRVDLGASYTAIDDGSGSEDCHGHGTHVAAIAGGASFGVAKGVTLHSVRVFDCAGRGSVSGIVAGLDWITARHSLAPRARRSASPLRAVVNMSLATAATQVLDDAVARSIATGLTYVVAAGNAGADACLTSPARVAAAITVGATNGSDARAAYSNFGGCVDLFAPGDWILSALAASDTATGPMSGTSMAAPHVAGTVALMLAVQPGQTPADVATLLRHAATPDVIAGAGVGSANLLLYSPFTGDGIDMAPVADFLASCMEGSCVLDAAPSADDRGIVAYRWDLGNGKAASGERSTARYGRKGPSSVVVTLTVTDTSGQTRSLEQTLRPGG